MKGLTHFISGIAAASFIPDVVRLSTTSSEASNPSSASFLLAIAGVYAIMPDTLDFKFGRFFEKADVDISPKPNSIDPCEMARTFGMAIDRAWQENREIRVQFNTVRLGADKWQQYEIKFNTDRQEISIVIGDVVTTSQVPFQGTAPEISTGTYSLKHAKLMPGTTRNTKVDILSGPMYGFVPEKECVRVDFLPWHRTWSHSYVVGLLLALPLWGIAAIGGWAYAWLYPIVAFIAFATHVTEDLTGHMGGSLIWPLYKKRSKGLALFHAANPDANFVTNFIAVIIIIFNLDRYGSRFITLPYYQYFLFFLVGPLLIYFLPRTFKKTAKIPPDLLRQENHPDIYRQKTDSRFEEIQDESESVIT
ncbi:metal-dependent hydrolase [bacterium]|nr:metal-dependent hydrolase [candidate division CSSED10-310 bacterium]